MKTIEIGAYTVGEGHPPLVVAEMSGNHNQSLERALEIVEEAKRCGAHALKLQTYTADTMTIEVHKGDFVISDQASPWTGRSLYDLYKEAYTPWEWHAPLLQRCRELGMLAFSTPFDETAVDFLETFDVPAYKIASFENAHLPLIRKTAATGKPIIISTGMATLGELAEAVEAVRSTGNDKLILLRCTSAYPTIPEDCNIRSIPHLRDLFDVPVGLSDHTPGIGVAVASVALGACVLEKHFTLRRSDGGPDAAFSLEPEELQALVTESLRAYQSLGTITYSIGARERPSRAFRRSLFVVQDMEAGEAFSAENVRIIRPGYGLAPKYLEVVLGKRTRRAIKRGTPLTFDLLT